jgi:hypothetical protein
MLGLDKHKIQEDLTFLKKCLKKFHPNPFFKTSEKSFNQRLHNFPSNPEIFDFIKLVSSLRDSHTRVHGLMEYLGSRVYPIDVIYLKDSYFYVSDSEGKRIVGINDLSVQEIEKHIGEIFACENKELLRVRLAEWIIEPTLINYLGFAEKDVTLEFEEGDTKSFTSINRNSFFPLEEKIKYDNEFTNIKGEVISSKYDKDLSILYIQYNDSSENSSEEIANLTKDIDRKSPRNIVVDLRNNLGWSSLWLDPLVDHLEKRKNETKTFCFVSRKTYSSAVINALDISDIKGSVSIGTKTSGSPTKFGQATKEIELPNSKLKIYISTKYFKENGFKFGEPFTPDYEIEPTVEEYLSGKDVVWEKFLDLKM